MDQDTASADKLGRVLSGAGDTVAVLHGSRSLSRRRAAREGFQRGTFRVLVPTDIAARGFDVADIGHVVQFRPAGLPGGLRFGSGARCACHVPGRRPAS